MGAMMIQPRSELARTIGDFALDVASNSFKDNNGNEFFAYDYGMTNDQVIREIVRAQHENPRRARIREQAKTTITITSKHQMSKDEFDSVKGTNLFGDLYRNRQHVSMPSLYKMIGRETLLDKLAEELEESCKGLFYIDPGTSFIYFSETVDAVQFKLTADGREEIVVYDVDR